MQWYVGGKRVLLRFVTAVVLSLLPLVLVTVSAGAAETDATQPGLTPVQKAEAIVKPSVVFIQTQWTGWLVSAKFGTVDVAQMLSSNGYAPKFTVTTSCTGFVANPNGYVVTAGHCIDDQSMQYGGKGLIVQKAVAEVARRASLSTAEAQALATYGYSNWTVEGKESGSAPDRVVGVYPTKPTVGGAATTALPANVVTFRAFDKGDVALLRVATQTPMPVLEVAAVAPLSSGTQVVAAGYPGSVSSNVDASTEPSMKDGTISGKQTIKGVPFTEISAATSAGMSGGPVVDLDGRVLGTVSWTPGSETQTFNFITDSGAVRDVLASNNVDNRLTESDQAFRRGLNEYAAGKYHAAVREFDQVLAVQPDHEQAQLYKRTAMQNFANEPAVDPGQAQAGDFPWLPIAIGVAVLVMGTAVLLVLRWRRAAKGSAHGGQISPPVPEASSGLPLRSEGTVPDTTEAMAEAHRLELSSGASKEHASYCAGCGHSQDPDARFCTFCGQPQLNLDGKRSSAQV